MGNNEDLPARLRVANNPNTPTETLTRLAGDTDSVVRGNVAGNKNTPPDTLTRLAGDTSGFVRMRVAGNETTPPETLIVLGADPDGDVRKRVAGNETTPPETLIVLGADPDGDVRKRVGRNRNTPPGSGTVSDPDPEPPAPVGPTKDADRPIDAVVALSDDEMADLADDLVERLLRPTQRDEQYPFELFLPGDLELESFLIRFPGKPSSVGDVFLCRWELTDRAIVRELEALLDTDPDFEVPVPLGMSELAGVDLRGFLYDEGVEAGAAHLAGLYRRIAEGATSKEWKRRARADLRPIAEWAVRRAEALEQGPLPNGRYFTGLMGTEGSIFSHVNPDHSGVTAARREFRETADAAIAKAERKRKPLSSDVIDTIDHYEDWAYNGKYRTHDEPPEALDDLIADFLGLR